MCVDFVVTIMEGVPGPSAVIEPRDRFHVKIVFLVTEIFVFCIQAKLSFVFRQNCVLYSGKIVFCIQVKLCFVFRQK